MKNNYYLIRHGESEANVQHILTCNPATAVSGYGLTERGKEQSKQSAHAFTQYLGGDVLIYTSDFLRAAQTADIFAETLNAPVIADIRLRERDFGKLDGTADGIYGPVWSYDTNPAENALGVESLHALLDRLRALIDELEKTYTDKEILLVSHGDPLVAINSYMVYGDLRPPVHNMRNAEVGRMGAVEPIVLPD